MHLAKKMSTLIQNEFQNFLIWTFLKYRELKWDWRLSNHHHHQVVLNNCYKTLLSQVFLKSKNSLKCRKIVPWCLGQCVGVRFSSFSVSIFFRKLFWLTRTQNRTRNLPKSNTSEVTTREMNILKVICFSSIDILNFKYLSVKK